MDPGQRVRFKSRIWVGVGFVLIYAGAMVLIAVLDGIGSVQ